MSLTLTGHCFWLAIVMIAQSTTRAQSTARLQFGDDVVSQVSAIECDLLIAGSGAAGFAAAVTASVAGLKVVVCEKAPVYGGTTCYSAGIAWIPGSSAARKHGIADTHDAVLDYLRAEGGNQLDVKKAETYVDAASDVLDWFEANSHVKFALVPGWPDYHPNQPGGSSGGRSLGPIAFDGRTLGANFANLRPPLSTTTILGGMMVGREDLVHFYSMRRNWRSALEVTKRFARYAQDRITYSRGTRLSNGSALIAMLARTAFERGVRLMLNAPVTRLIYDSGRVTGAFLAGQAGEIEVHAKNGVILATGGFPSDPVLRQRVGDTIGTGSTHQTLAPVENTGDGLKIATGVGGGLVTELKQPAAWTPVSLVPNVDGTTTPFPHFFDRGKAGYIAVTRKGRRFVNEAVSYHDFVPAMVEACRDDVDVECWLLTDHSAILNYGLGMAPPAPARLAPHIASGYIKRSKTLAGLAQLCGIDPSALIETITQFNGPAANGQDPQFGKGDDVYHRFNGSAGVSPNPCVKPLDTPPFYAIRLVPGDIGTFVGLRTDEDAQVLDRDQLPIQGLYAVGNDAASFMGGAYPGAGITIGPALVFGHRAARHALSGGKPKFQS
jgi:succinate dehydrogenase/fumarate reductase flavoprotein subunit